MRHLLASAAAISLAACANHMSYRPPPSSALRSATSLDCVVLPTDDETHGEYTAGWGVWQARLIPADVVRDTQAIAVNVVDAAKVCGKVSAETSPEWNDARRDQLRAAGHRVAARLVIERLILDAGPHWWGFISPFSLLAIVPGLPTFPMWRTAHLAARLDLVDLQTGDVAYSFRKETEFEVSLRWSGNLVQWHEFEEDVDPAWRQWSDAFIEASSKELAPRLVAIESGTGGLSGAMSGWTGRLAVLEFRSRMKEAIDLIYFSDLVRGRVLSKAPRMNVMTRENLLVLLQASGKTADECEGECEVDTARRIGADFVISGDVTRIGRQIKLTLKLHDSHSGRLLGSSIAEGIDQEGLEKSAIAAVDQLFPRN